MDVLLVYPKVYKSILIKEITIPLSVVSIATFLSEQGYSCKVIDLNFESNGLKRIKKEVSKGPFCVGISSLYSSQALSGLRVSEVIRDTNPEMPIIWGGMLPTIIPEETVKDPRVDIAVRGEGEEIMFNLLKSFEKNKDIDKVKGITYKKSNKIRSNPDSRPLNLDKLPFVNYDFVKSNFDKYVKLNPVETSRGCPFNCDFCGSANSWRGKNIDRTIDEIEYVQSKWHSPTFQLVDRNAWVGNRLLSFCKELKKRSLDIELIAYQRIEFCSRDELRALSDVGFKRLIIGLESGSQRVLKLLKKEISMERLLKYIENFNYFDVIPHLSFMTGLPYEKREDVVMTLDLIDKIKDICPKAQISWMSIYRPVEGTPIYELYKREGIPLPETLEEHARYREIDMVKNTYLETVYYVLGFMNSSHNRIFKSKSVFDPLKLAFILISPYISLRYKKRFFRFSPETKIFRCVYNLIN